MSLYDDIDEGPKPKAVPTGWSSGIKLLQSQLQLKKAMVTQPKREAVRKAVTVVNASDPSTTSADQSPAPVKAPRETKVFFNQTPILPMAVPKLEKSSLISELDWDLSLEYDPMHPNDYDKITKERRERRGLEIEIEEAEKKRRAREDRDKTKDKTGLSGFAGRIGSDDEEESPAAKKSSVGGVAIAPPPSLQQEISPASGPSSVPAGGLGVAAKIMAKYGFKEGQGLGRQQQGISTALQVEKTSKRGGRIINEKEVMPPPPAAAVSSPPAPKPELTIAEMMKNPSKVILLRNMVGPGQVDSDLEPEVREECHTKYGDVHKVIIYELPEADETEAVRIFVEFKRIEAAIKAVIDLNGRFFAGRQVKAGFYDVNKFTNLELNE